ncbi:MAG: beta-ketoacyl synthase N-terminal-like domain-containing protein, partial [Flavobacteriaceae bacterium]
MNLDSASLHRNPRTDKEKSISKVWTKYLGIPNIGIDDNFFEMGGDSLLTQQVCDALNKQYKLHVTATQLFQYPTIALLSEHLFPTKVETSSFKFPLTKKKERTTEDIAIIGMAGKFPGASNLNEFWELLKEGKETISFFKPEELDFSIPDTLKNDPQYVKARGIVPSAKTFDASFFKINQKLAEIMDPQIRLFLEI